MDRSARYAFHTDADLKALVKAHTRDAQSATDLGMPHMARWNSEQADYAQAELDRRSAL